MLQGAMSAGIPDAEFSGLQGHAAAMDPGDPSANAQMLRAVVQTHRDWVRQNNQRAALRMAWKNFYKEWDILLCPQSPTVAFPHDHGPQGARTLDVDGIAQPYFQQVFWAGLITVAYLPSTVFPTGLSEAGLPIGLQAVGGEYQDRTCIEFARLMANEFGGFVSPPAY
jgi:amidase